LKTVTYKFSVGGDNHQEIIDNIKKEISSYLAITSDDPLKYVNYEVSVDNTADKNLPQKYNALVIARIKDDIR
jgi:hypothetical protein